MQKDEIVKRLREISDKNIININKYNEENVKIHVVNELLRILEHSDYLDAEHNYGTDRPDIFIKGFEMPILIEVKGANEDIDSHIPQIKRYSYNMDSLLSILTNGNLFYFFSPFWKRKSFEERLVLSFSLKDLQKEEIINKLLSLLKRDIGFEQISKNIEILENEISAKQEEINKKQRDILNLENKAKSIKDKYHNIEVLINAIEHLEPKIKSEIQEFLSINEQISFFNSEIGRLRKEIPSINIIEDESDIIIKDNIIDTEDGFLKSVPKEINELYNTLKNQILAIDENIKVIPRGNYIGFDSQRNFVGILPQKRKLKIWLNLGKGQLNDPNKIARDVSNLGHWGNGDYEINFSPGDELLYLMTLIKQSYEKNS
ncbi:MAG: DUF5655 domain-containing protein [Candidatus Methanoperedens sp.]